MLSLTSPMAYHRKHDQHGIWYRKAGEDAVRDRGGRVDAPIDNRDFGHCLFSIHAYRVAEVRQHFF